MYPNPNWIDPHYICIILNLICIFFLLAASSRVRSTVPTALSWDTAKALAVQRPAQLAPTDRHVHRKWNPSILADRHVRSASAWSDTSADLDHTAANRRRTAAAHTTLKPIGIQVVSGSLSLSLSLQTLGTSLYTTQPTCLQVTPRIPAMAW